MFLFLTINRYDFIYLPLQIQTKWSHSSLWRPAPNFYKLQNRAQLEVVKSGTWFALVTLRLFKNSGANILFYELFDRCEAQRSRMQVQRFLTSKDFPSFLHIHPFTGDL